MVRASSSRRSKSASASGNAAISSRETCLFFKYSHPHGATSLNSAWPCKAQMRPPCNFSRPAFSSGSWLPASRTGCTPASRHIRRKRARFSNPSSRQGLSRVSLRSPHTTRWEHPSRRNPSSSGSRASALAWPKWMSEINLARSPGARSSS